MACGSALDRGVAAPVGRPTEERRNVSILFVDLVGFIERSDRADPEDVRRTLAPFHPQRRYFPPWRMNGARPRCCSSERTRSRVRSRCFRALERHEDAAITRAGAEGGFEALGVVAQFRG
jgi:hypothetical protein